MQVRCFDGENEEVFTLYSQDKGIYISNLTWREIYGYSKDSVLVSLASGYYSEEDYIRYYEEFISLYNESEPVLV